MTVKEAAAYLTERGYPCKAGSVRKLATLNKIRCRRPGPTGRGRYEFSAERLDEFLAQSEWNPPGPPAPKVKAQPKPRPLKTKAGQRVSDWQERLKEVLGK
jgi:hypothetical protein